MNKITGNEPLNAILIPTKAVNGVIVANDIIQGLTIRQHFAAMAIQGLCSNDGWTKTLISDDWDDYIKRLTEGSVEIADALIAELNKTNSQ